jgi:hypothetical protein
MLRWPTARLLVVYVATPLLFRLAVFSTLLPSMKETEPAGVAPLPVTVAVKVTGVPKETEVVDAERLTVAVPAAEERLNALDTLAA